IRIRKVVIELQLAGAKQHLVSHRWAEDVCQVNDERAAEIFALEFARNLVIRRIPPKPPRETLLLVFTRQPHIEFGLIAYVVVNAADNLISVIRTEDAVYVVFSGLVWIGEVWQWEEVKQRLAECIATGRQIIVRRGITSRDTVDGATVRNQHRGAQLAEIAQTHFLCGREVQRGTLVNTLVVILVAGKEEQLVSLLVEVRLRKYDRPANVPAGIVVLA